jgi:DUF1009 family protein
LSVAADGRGNLRIDLPWSGRATVRVLDTRGRTALSTDFRNGLILNTGMLNPGIYIVEACHFSEILRTKITIAQ